MQLYLDTANPEIIKKFHRTLPLQGVTTNPSILAKEKQPVAETLQAIQQIIGENGQLFAQTLGRSAQEMIDNALALREIVPTIVVKIPVIPEGVVAIKSLTRLGVPTLGTAVYGAMQGLLAALAGAAYIAPYVNRIDAQGGSGIDVVRELQTLLEKHTLNSVICAASFRTPRQALDCLLAGCRSITLPPDIAQTFLNDPAVFAALEKFEDDWQNTYQRNTLL